MRVMRYIDRPEAGLDIRSINRAIESAFAEHGRGSVQMPPKAYISLKKGDFRTMPAYLPGKGIAGVKIVSVNPENPGLGLPTVMALIIILDTGTGIPRTILNATALTDLRTGAAGAVATSYLSQKKEGTLGVVGAGRQAAALCRAIAAEYQVTSIRVATRSEASGKRFCAGFPDTDCQAVSIRKACDVDVLVTATPSRVPIVKNEWIGDGTHINAIGADAPGKQELDPLILSRARVFVDDPVQAIHSGEINVPISKGLFSPGQISGTIGEVVNGLKGRMSPEEVTVFDSTGLAIQDLAIAALVVENGSGVELRFP
jgi:alanine dehydrogenase